MKSINLKNEQRQQQNEINLKNQEFESLDQILNRPIAQDYDHRNLGGRVRGGKFGFNKSPFDDVESTIKMTLMFESMRNDPNGLTKALGICRRSDFQSAKKQINLAPLSPTHKIRFQTKKRLFDTITKDVRDYKMHSRQDLLSQSPSNAQKLNMKPSQVFSQDNKSTVGNVSYISNASKAAKTLHQEALDNLWSGPYFVIFMKDGVNLKHQKPKSIKVDISQFIQKYRIKPPKFIAQLPENYLKRQREFFERAYMELMEFLSNKLDERKKDDDITPKAEFKSIFTVQGHHISTMEDLQVFLVERRNQNTEDPNNHISLDPDNDYANQPSQSNVNLPNLSKLSLHQNKQMLAEDTFENPIAKINIQKKAQFISYSPSSQLLLPTNRSQVSIQNLGEAEPARSMAPPLLLLSVSEEAHAFQGLTTNSVVANMVKSSARGSKPQLSARDLRRDNSVDVKNMMNQLKDRWGSRSILDYIETSIDQGGSTQMHNVESIIKVDVNQKYTADNELYRQKILQRLGSKDSTNPVFIGGAPKNDSKFFLPMVENGSLQRLRNRLLNSTIGADQSTSKQFNNFDHPNQHLEIDDPLGMGGGTTRAKPSVGIFGENKSPGNLSIFSPNQSSIKFAAMGGIKNADSMAAGSWSLRTLSNTKWQEDFVGKVDELKKQYKLENKVPNNDKYGQISPHKGNFEALSRQFSKSTVADILYKSANEDGQSSHQQMQPVHQSLKKIAGNFNINMNLKSERVLPGSLTRPSQESSSINQIQSSLKKGAHKASYLKNIAHLNIPKKSKQQKLSIEEVDRLSRKYNLDSDLILELQMDFNCYVEISKDKGDPDLLYLAGQQERPDPDKDLALSQRVVGVPSDLFFKQYNPLKEKHPSIALKMLSAVGTRLKTDENGMPLVLGNPKITFQKFLELESLLRCFTASQETYVDFWYNFFNPHNLPEISRDEVETSLELLSRGSYTQQGHLVSETFAKEVISDWLSKGCFVKGKEDQAIDSIALKRKMQTGEVSIETLNQCLHLCYTKK